MGVAQFFTKDDAVAGVGLHRKCQRPFWRKHGGAGGYQFVEICKIRKYVGSQNELKMHTGFSCREKFNNVADDQPVIEALRFSLRNHVC